LTRSARKELLENSQKTRMNDWLADVFIAHNKQEEEEGVDVDEDVVNVCNALSYKKLSSTIRTCYRT